LTPAPDAGAVRREVQIAARPAAVFDFLTDPLKLARWAGTDVVSEPRSGGRFRAVINAGHIISGTYVEVVPSQRLVYTWGWEDSVGIPPGSSMVEIILVAHDGGTRLTVVHTGLPPAVGPGHGDVWDHYLPRLALAAQGRDPGRDAWDGSEGM
jgi:uncharacterized protein YndB with AHSA1/START domain